MNDIFYFSEEVFSLKDLHDFLSSRLSNSLFINKNLDAMQVELESGDGSWDIFPMDTLRDFEEPGSVEIITKTNVKTAFCISHHSYTLPELKKVLKIVLEHFGGWVGNYSDGFAPRFTLNNIAFLSYY